MLNYYELLYFKYTICKSTFESKCPQLLLELLPLKKNNKNKHWNAQQ